jgi:hypothetical protein
LTGHRNLRTFASRCARRSRSFAVNFRGTPLPIAPK